MLPTHSIRKPTPRKKTEASVFQSQEKGGSSNKKLFLLLAFLVIVSLSSMAYIWDLQSSLAEAQVEKEVSTIQVQELQKMVRANSIERSNFQQALLDSQNSVSEREKTISSLRSQLSDCRSSLDDLSTQKLLADSQHFSGQADVGKLTSKITDLQNQRDEAKAKLKESIGNRDQILKDKEELEARVLDLEKQLNQSKKQLEGTQRASVDSQQKLEQQQQQDQQEKQDQRQPDQGSENQPKLSFTPSVPDQDPESEERRQAVKGAMKFAWDMYEKYAWGKDELKPISKTGSNWFNLGVTIVDSIDTLFIMGLEDEYQKARDWIKNEMDFSNLPQSSMFELVIRELGGLLSIYTLTGDSMFLDRAEALGHIVLDTFDTPTGFPLKEVHTPKSGRARDTSERLALSEVASVQMEMLYLAYHTGNAEFADKPMEVFKKLREMKPADSLYPAYVNPGTSTFYGNRMTLGALADSFYEYQLKLWLLTNKQYDGYRKMYQDCSNALIDKLVKKTKSGLTYVDQIQGRYLNTMEHLACFAGGMFALGAHEEAVSNIEEQFEVGAEITKTCWVLYDSMPTGTGIEIFEFDEFGVPKTRETSNHYILRPEAVESLFVMWRLTHDQKYRDWGWQIFQAIEKNCKTPGGYAGIQDVTVYPVVHNDRQQSFFMAETLKYLYLLFSPDDVIPLSEFVFNTEAHPFRIIPETSDSMPRDLHKHLMLF